MKLPTRIKDHISSRPERFRKFLHDQRKDLQVKPPPSRFGTALFDSIEFVPEAIWSALNRRNIVFLQPDYLRALEAVPPEGMDFRYAILYDGKTPAAIAYFQILEVDASRYGPKRDWSATGRIRDLIGAAICKAKEKHLFRMLVCGNALIGGDYGFAYRAGDDPKEIFHGLAEVAYKIQQAEKINGDINCVLIKDFSQEDTNPSDRLRDFGYHHFSVGPIMNVPIRAEWQSFDDYLVSMTGKYRRRARSAIKKGAGLVRKILSADDIVVARETIYNLYLQVQDRSRYRLLSFDSRIFEELKGHLGAAFTLIAYYLDDRMVAFTTRLISGDTIEGYKHGIDYALNRELALYQNILYDDIRAGIDSRASLVNFGRTSIAMKSSVGAVPKEMICYLRLNNPMANHLISPLFYLIHPEDEHVRSPFGERDDKGEVPG